ncbi:MAG TPA: hypothetical protein VF168_00590 [Trueperaceae bacterium]
MRPKFGIGIAIGALLVIGTQLSGSDSAFAMVLGGGVGVALGLTGRSLPGKLATAAEEQEEPEADGR